MLIQLLYISEHNDTTQIDLNQFMARSRERNTLASLTSILLSTSKYYIHLIEGNRSNVNVLYNKISNDPKHFNSTILRYIEIKKREFNQWSAEHVSIDEFNIGNMNLLLPFGEINIDTISATQAVTMIRRIHAHLQIRVEDNKNTRFKPLTDK